MTLWKTVPTVEQLNHFSQGCIHDALGIQFTAVGEDFLEGSMPVDHRTQNPLKILHGGASVVLAESLGSVAAILVAGSDTKRAVGIEINASHLRSARPGTLVYGRATPIRIGKSLQVWEIRIRDQKNTDAPVICVCRLTVMIQDLP